MKRDRLDLNNLLFDQLQLFKFFTFKMTNYNLLGEKQRTKNKTKQNKAKQNKTKQNKTKQNKTKQNKTKQNTKQNKKTPQKTKQNKKQDKTKQKNWCMFYHKHVGIHSTLISILSSRPALENVRPIPIDSEVHNERVNFCSKLIHANDQIDFPVGHLLGKLTPFTRFYEIKKEPRDVFVSLFILLVANVWPNVNQVCSDTWRFLTLKIDNLVRRK